MFIPVSVLIPKILNLAKKIPLWFWLIGVIGVGYWYYNNKLDTVQAEMAEALLAGDSTVTLLEGEWRARLVQKNFELASANDLADELNAKLVASATIIIIPAKVKRDTVRLVTTILDDSTRIAVLSDTSASVILDLEVTAPPCCQDIRVTFTLTPRPIEFDVALVQLADNKAVFAVSYFGGTTQITTAYARLPAKRDRFKPFVGTRYDFSDASWALQGGVELDLVFGVKLDAFIQQDLNRQTDEQSLRLLMQGRKYF